MASKATMGCISMKSIRSSIISLVHVTVFFLHFGVSSFPAIFAQHVVVIIYIHKLILIRILSSDWSISIQVSSKLKTNRMHFYSIQVRSSFLIQVSCMVYTIKKLEWRLGCKTCIVYTAGADPGFQVRGGGGGGALKKIAPSGGMRENFWGILCEKSRFYAKKSYFF